MYEYNAKLVRVIDGDTLVLEIDLGFHIKVTETVRLAGINTPERGQPGYQDAINFVQQWATGHPLIAKTTKQDKYGRWLAIVYDANGQEVSLNGHLLATKLAVPYGS